MSSIRKRPDGAWRARYRDPDGREHARHFARRVDAERWLSAVNGDLVRGTYIDPRAGRLPFGTYAEEWRLAQPHRRSTAALYERLLRLHAYPTLGSRPLSAVRRSEIQAWITGLSGRVAPATSRQIYAITRSIFRAAVADKLLTESPCQRIALPRIPVDKVVPLRVDEVRAIADAAPVRLRALVLLAAGTGLRSGELLGLRTHRVDFLRRTVEVAEQLVYVPGSEPFFGPPKTESSRRVVPVPTFALEALAEHLRAYPPGPDGLIFQADKGGPLLRTSLHGRWVRTLARAGLPTTTRLHHLRHFYASVLIDGGESVKVVQERLGHASAVETLKTYAHLWPTSDERTRAIVERAWSDPADSVRTLGLSQAPDQGR